METTKLSLEQARVVNEALAEIYENIAVIYNTQTELAKSTCALLEALKKLNPDLENVYLKYLSDETSQKFDEILHRQISSIELAIQKLRK